MDMSASKYATPLWPCQDRGLETKRRRACKEAHAIANAGSRFQVISSVRMQGGVSTGRFLPKAFRTRLRNVGITSRSMVPTPAAHTNIGITRTQIRECLYRLSHTPARINLSRACKSASLSFFICMYLRSCKSYTNPRTSSLDLQGP